MPATTSGPPDRMSSACLFPLIVRGTLLEDGLQRLGLVSLTGYDRTEDRARAIAAGFDDHLVKPVGMEALGALVSRLVSERNAAKP